MRLLPLLLFVVVSFAALAQDSKPVPAQKDTVNMDKLRRSYRAQIVSGTLELAAGAGFFTGFALVRKEAVGETIKHKRSAGFREARLYFVAGTIFSGIGIYSLAKGSKNRCKYVVSVAPGSASLRITF